MNLVIGDILFVSQAPLSMENYHALWLMIHKEDPNLRKYLSIFCQLFVVLEDDKQANYVEMIFSLNEKEF